MCTETFYETVAVWTKFLLFLMEKDNICLEKYLYYCVLNQRAESVFEYGPQPSRPYANLKQSW